MSRLIVKNLPKSVSEDKLRKFFESNGGQITDLQLKYTPEGKFRQFGFIGFKTAEEATKAKEYYDGTYFGMSKISVLKSYGIRDNADHKVWSKHYKRNDKRKFEDVDTPEEMTVGKEKIRKEDEIFEKCKMDPKFVEFLETYNKDKGSWSNDSSTKKLDIQKIMAKVEEPSKDVKDDEEENALKSKDQDEGDKNNEEQNEKKAARKLPELEFMTVKIRNLPKNARKKHIKSFFAPLKPKSVRLPRQYRGFAYVGFDNELDRKKALNKNRMVLLGKKVSVYKYENDAMKAEKSEARFTNWKEKEEIIRNECEGVEETGRIFLRNLSYSATEDDVRELFEKYGPVTEVHLPLDRITRTTKGIGFVTFMMPEHAKQSFEELDGCVFQGRNLHLLPSKSKVEPDSVDLKSGSSFKREKELKMKGSSGLSHNWNALFLGQNSISEVAAKKYGVSKEILLLDEEEGEGGNASNAAVRMALAESEVVSEVISFFRKNGIDLSVFDDSNKVERSRKIILVKNLTHDVTTDDLKALFEKHGVIGRVLLPPHGITAIVEFTEPAEARGAFKKLAYSNFKGKPLYLEWAPAGMVKDTSEINSLKNSQPIDTTEPASLVPTQLTLWNEEIEPVDESLPPETDTTLFVKNLNFKTDENALEKHFKQCGPIYSVVISKKKDPNNADSMLSMGYGFVQYFLRSHCERALECLDKSVLMNHTLELKQSARTLFKQENNNNSKSKGSKLVVRNIPFQATSSEIGELFKTFGRIKAVRLPKKLIGSEEHRGFGFVEFSSEEEAEVMTVTVTVSRALNVLGKSTHLYGRRLVVEWAAKNETVDDIRRRTAENYSRIVSQEKGGRAEHFSKKSFKRYFETTSDAGAQPSNAGSDVDD